MRGRALVSACRGGEILPVDGVGAGAGGFRISARHVVLELQSLDTQARDRVAQRYGEWQRLLM